MTVRFSNKRPYVSRFYLDKFWAEKVIRNAHLETLFTVLNTFAYITTSKREKHILDSLLKYIIYEDLKSENIFDY